MRTNREQILKTLADHRQEIAQRFGVKNLALFGSAARDELRDDRDVDVLVEFEGPSTYDGYFKLQDYLQALLGRSVDLVTERGLKPRAAGMWKRTSYVSRDWLLYLDDVIESAEKIQRFLGTATLDTFSAYELLFDAVLYNLQVIGEAVKKLPAEAKAMSPGRLIRAATIGLQAAGAATGGEAR